MASPSLRVAQSGRTSLTPALDYRQRDGDVARHGLLLGEGASLHPGLPLRPVLLTSQDLRGRTRVYAYNASISGRMAA